MGKKKCSACRKEKDAAEFYGRAESRDGLQGRCKDCSKAVAHKWHAANRTRQKANQRAWCKRNPERRKAQLRKSEIKQNFGISLEQYAAMEQVQCGVCAICTQPEVAKDHRSGRQKHLAVDHCHATGKVRGLLCHKCNLALGLFNDDLTMIATVADYLRRSSG